MVRNLGGIMLKYIERNVNPKNRKTGDCSTRALVTVLGLSYEECLRLQTEESLKCFYDPTSKQVMERILSKFGFIKMKHPRKWDNSKYEVRELDSLIGNKTALVTVANHHTAVLDGAVIDIWDCRRKSVGNYYIRK